jgi:hypothetical protein
MDLDIRIQQIRPGFPDFALLLKRSLFCNVQHPRPFGCKGFCVKSLQQNAGLTKLGNCRSLRSDTLRALLHYRLKWCLCLPKSPDLGSFALCRRHCLASL